MRCFAVLAVSLVSVGACWCQDEEKKAEEKPKPSVNLDTKKVDVTARYLCNASTKLQQLEAEAEQTGNHTKLNDFQKKITADLKTWEGATVSWLVQVESIGQSGQTEIKAINAYGFKNQAQLYLHTDSNHIGAARGVFGIGRGSHGSGGISGRRRSSSEEDDKPAFDEKWARTLKRGDYMIVEGKIESAYISHGGEVPVITVKPLKYSTANPKKGK